MKKVIEYLESICSFKFSSELKAYLLDVLQQQTIKRKTKVLRVGQIRDRIYFIEKGLFRCYVMRGDAEICKWFMREGNIMISVNSFFNRKDSTEIIEALEESEVYWITFAQLQEMYGLFPEFRRVGQRLTEIYYCASEVRADDLRMKNSDELYKDWIADNPELAGRINKSHIASYFGVTLSTLSRGKKTPEI